MKVLIVRLSSMGDVVQTLPAIEDATRVIPGISFDWVIDESFADIPKWHPSVETVIAASLRRWRGDATAFVKDKQLGAFIKQVRATRYDAVVDLQGVIKSAAVTRLARGRRIGYDSRSVHEWGAQAAYRRRIRVAKGRHSIARMRELLASALGYELPATAPSYGVDPARLPPVTVPLPGRFVVVVHATSWTSKNWHADRWKELGQLAAQTGYVPVLAWGDDAEKERAEFIAGEHGLVLPQLSIAEKAAVIARASAVIGLDTGLSHIAAAFGVPGVSLYGATDPDLVGATGANQINLATTFECKSCHQRQCTYPVEPELKPACFSVFDPQMVWSLVGELIASR